MKSILLAFYLFITLSTSGIATSVPPSMEASKEPSIESHINPIKVSEINANLFSTIYDFFQNTGADIFEGFVSLKDFVETREWFIESLETPEIRTQVVSFSFRLLIAFLVSFILAQGFAFWLKPKIQNLLKCKTHPPFEKIKRLFSATFLSIMAPLFFGLFLYTLSRLINPKNEIYLEIVRILSSGSVIIWTLLNVAHLFLKPLTPDHQHIPLSREVLATSYAWIRRMAMIALFGFFALETGALIDLPPSGEKLLLQGTGFIISIMAILMMLTLHEDVKNWILKQQQNHHLSLLKRVLLPYLQYSYIPIIILILISYVSWVTHEPNQFQAVIWKSLFTLALFPLLRILVFCLRKIRVLYLNKYIAQVSPPLAGRLLFYGHQIDFVALTLLNLGAILFILELWNLNPSSFIFSNIGRSIAEKTFSIFTIIVVALFITRAGNGLLTKYLNATKENLSDAQKQKAARFKTIYSVSRNILRIAIWTPAILLIIVELEVDIVPLLATVGILSVGISFGVQSLIKDFVTGFFMLLEDAFAVGDLVVINGQMGRIDSLTVRVVRLRATDGSLFTFPYGNITSLCNQNRDFSAVLLFFKVGFEADIQQVFEILERISKDLRKDPTTRKLIAPGPIEIDGVNEINDHALEIRVVLKTKPSEHYKVKWAFNRLLKQYLKDENIPLGTPRQVSFNYALEK